MSWKIVTLLVAILVCFSYIISLAVAYNRDPKVIDYHFKLQTTPNYVIQGH